MELQLDKQAVVTRLGLCIVAALVLYQIGEKVCTSFGLPYWEQYRPWLEKNRVQAVAIVTAVLFGLSLAVLPLERREPPVPPPEEFIPCGPEPFSETQEEAPHQ
ncbi:MAG: hypothetical protein HFE97_05775 [Oscillospiraceae bacterium]|nr:hypothetical protein [Oscillospiraceae bacterium]